MNSTNVDWVVVGRFCRPHGIKGAIAVLSFTEPRENILNYASWHIQIKGAWCPIQRLTEENTHKHILVRIKGYPEREDVACLTNADIAIPRHELPSLDVGERYWHELMGMTVIQVNEHKDNVILGLVVEILATGSNDVLIVEGEGQRHLIPYLPHDVILNVDDQTRSITVDWDVDF